MQRNLFATAVLAGAVLASSNVSALSLTFTGISSDLTDPGFLDATLDLTVSNSGGNDLLTLALTNLSDTTSTAPIQIMDLPFHRFFSITRVIPVCLV